MLVGMEDTLIKENPDYLMVYVDMNFYCIAGASVASKIHILHTRRGGACLLTWLCQKNRIESTDHYFEPALRSTDASIENLENEE